MKNMSFLAAALLCGAALFAQSPAQVFNWSLFESGSWEGIDLNSSDGSDSSSSSQRNSTLHNRGELRLNFLPLNLSLRGQVLDRRTLNFELDPPWFDPEKAVTNFNGALYHKTTGSRFLFGVLDEWGLPARIRNPWIRSPPYAENHRPIMADLKTTASSTKEDEAYLYLSSPFLELFPDIRMRGFLSAQTETGGFSPALSGGVDMVLKKSMNLLFETFYTGVTLPPTKSSSWFSDPPPLPEREFDLYAAGVLFSGPLFSLSTDWAFSQTFAWGTGVYGNLGISVTPSLPFGKIKRPLTVSLAMDGAGERFVYRDGANHGEGFRSALKAEWKGERNSLFRVNTVLRANSFGEDFNRVSAGFYYRFPAAAKNSVSIFRLTRISLTVDRNAENPQKIADGLSGYVGFSLNLRNLRINSPFGINISGSIKGLTSSEADPEEPWLMNSSGINCEFTWSPLIFQFKTKAGYSVNAKNDEKWLFSLSGAARFKYGRLSLKLESPDFPEKWSMTVSWNLQKR
jgi:hypothetical protein